MTKVKLDGVEHRKVKAEVVNKNHNNKQRKAQNISSNFMFPSDKYLIITQTYNYCGNWRIKRGDEISINEKLPAYKEQI